MKRPMPGRGCVGLLMLALVVGCASTPPEEDPVQLKLNDLDGRVVRLERSMANEVSVSQHVDDMQASLRELQGRIEELEHSNEALTKQQRDLYADLDKRLGGNGTLPGAAAGAAAGGAAGAAGAGAAAGAAANNAPSSTEQAVYAQA